MNVLTLLLILLPLLAGPAVCQWGRRGSTVRTGVIAVLALELGLALLLTRHTGETLFLPELCGLGISFSASGLQIWLCLLAGFLWLVSGLFSGRYLERDGKQHRYYMFLLLTEGAIMGVFLSADLFTTLVFFEMMSFASYPLVIHRETKEALRAGASYLTYAVLGGMISLMGLFLLWNLLGTLRFAELPASAAAYTGSPAALYAAGGLALVTFAAKVCMFPLHTWLPGSYAEAPAPATALLSSIITKAGIFGIFGLTAKLFFRDAGWGNSILLFGIVTALVGGTLALFNTNLKKTIAYSSMSQIGFILVSTGMIALLGEENGLAVWGSILHLTNHSLIKLVLLLAAGVVVYHVGELDYNAIRGFGRGKPALAFAFLMPALGVMGVPLWNGYISKTMIHEAIVEYIELLEETGRAAGLYHAVEWLFLIAGGMTVCYMTKLFICIFVERNTDAALQQRYDGLNGRYLSRLWFVLLDGCALLFPLLGMTAPVTIERIAAYTQDFLGSGVENTLHYFSCENLKGGCISILIGAALYLAFVRTVVRTKSGYRNRWPAWLDLEERVYKPLLFQALPLAGALCARFAGSLFEWFTALCNRILFFRCDPIVHPPEDDYFARYRAEDPGVRGYRGRIAYGLVLFGAGFVAVICFLLAVNFLL